MMHIKKPIGVFDSGIGGLAVLRELQRALPHEHFVYFADTANLPYGEKTPDQIIGYARQTIKWMQDEIGAKLVVAACNTTSAIALDLVAGEFSVPVIGAISPMVETVLKRYPDRRIGLIATPASVESRVHEDSLKKAGFGGTIYSVSCPRFVPIIESGRLSGPELLRCAIEYLSIFEEMDLNTLIYGCTHYPWIASIIRHVLPSGVDFIDPAEHIAAKVSQNLYKYKIINTSFDKVKTDFYCSDSADRFSVQVNLLMSVPNPKVTLVSLGNAPRKDIPLPEKIAINQ